MNYFLLLAQEQAAAKTADGAVDTLTKLGKAGPTVIALAIATVAVVGFVWVLRKNWQLQKDHETALKNIAAENKQESDERLKQVLDSANDRRETEKELMREMVAFGADSNEAVKEGVKAIENNTKALETLLREVEHMRRDLTELRRGGAA